MMKELLLEKIFQSKHAEKNNYVIGLSAHHNKILLREWSTRLLPQIFFDIDELEEGRGGKFQKLIVRKISSDHFPLKLCAEALYATRSLELETQ